MTGGIWAGAGPTQPGGPAKKKNKKITKEEMGTRPMPREKETVCFHFVSWGEGKVKKTKMSITNGAKMTKEEVHNRAKGVV